MSVYIHHTHKKQPENTHTHKLSLSFSLFLSLSFSISLSILTLLPTMMKSSARSMLHPGNCHPTCHFRNCPRCWVWIPGSGVGRLQNPRGWGSGSGSPWRDCWREGDGGGTCGPWGAQTGFVVCVGTRAGTETLLSRDLPRD